jgi:hypothetical protein
MDVPGRIHLPQFRAFWEDTLQAGPEVMEIIRNGYRIPFDSIPPPSLEPNNKSALRQLTILRSELKRLESIGAIERVLVRPRITLPCSVVFSTKLRVVVDTSRAINPWVTKNPVKLDSLRASEDVSLPGDFMTKQDLTSGYYHVMLHEAQRENFGVHFVFPDGAVWFWRWRVLFLGERNAVSLFTRILKPHRRLLAAHGIRNCLMIDDFLILSANFLKSLMDTQFHLEALEAAGWVVKPKKCINHPTQSIEFLGLIKDSVRQCYFVPAKKKKNILALVDRIISSDFVPVRTLAGVYGKLIGIYKALGPIVRMLLRFGFACINSCESWNQLVYVTADCKKELHFVREHLDELEGFGYENLDKPMVVFSRTLASDASARGAAVVEFSCEKVNLLAQTSFSEDERSMSSTFRELLAFHESYASNAQLFANSSVLHYTDSMNVARMFEIGSRRSHLHSLLFEIFLSLNRFNVKLSVEWLPRSDPTLVVADYFSRDLDLTDFRLSGECFSAISSTWGPFSLDVFASDLNKRVNRFFSRTYSDYAVGMNAFAFSWDNEHVWMSPPISLVVPAIKHFLASSACSGVLLCPRWPSSSFWHLLVPDGCHFAKFVVNRLEFYPKYYSGRTVKSKMFTGVPRWASLALFLDTDCSTDCAPDFVASKCLLFGCSRCE